METIRLWRGIPNNAPKGDIGEFFTSDRSVAEEYMLDDEGDPCPNPTLFYIDIPLDLAQQWKVMSRGIGEYHLPVEIANTALEEKNA